MSNDVMKLLILLPVVMNARLSCFRFKQLEDAAEEEAQKLESTISHTGNQKKDESSSTELLDPMGSSDIGFSGGLLSNLFGSMGAGFAMARQPWWKG